MPMFVPLVTVDVQPAKNGDRPGIELTTRTCQCPSYEVALIRALWAPPHGESVTEKPLPEGRNPLYELVSRDGLSPLASEVKRLTSKYGKTFQRVYREGEIAEKIKACSESANVFLENAAQRDAEMAARSAEKAADALVKASQKSVAEAFEKAEKRGPGRPRKITQEPASADA